MPSQITEVSFGQWLPDAADYKNPGLTLAQNVVPRATGYGAFLGPVGQGVTITGEIRGVRRFVRSDSTVVQIVGTDADLFVVTGGTATASGYTLSLAENVFWSFQRFGRQVWAFAYGETPKYITDIDTVTSFIDHPGTAPRARSAGRVADFLVTSNMVDIDTSTQPYRIRWSQFNNPAGDYGTSIAAQSGFVDMPQVFGEVIGVFGGRSDVVLQRYGVHRLSYTGGSTAFRLDIIEEERGCVSLPSVVTVGSNVYFLANDGFCRTDGANVVTVSDNRVWDWFQKNASVNDVEKVQGAVNWAERCVIWNFIPSNGRGYSGQIIYSFAHDKWSTAVVANEWLFDTVERGVTLEELAVTYPDLDDMEISLDSAEFRSKDRALAAVIGGELQNMTGAPLKATIETGEFQPEVGFRVCTSAITPLVENLAENTTIAVGSREAFKGDVVKWTEDEVVGSSGFAPVIKDGRYLRARMTVPAGVDWQQATGMQVEYNVTGRT